jgi:hypothetical protein
MDRNEYLLLRKAFKPIDVRLAIVAESPPISGKYFYDISGSIKEPLFAAMMLQLGIAPKSKESGLKEFQKRGWMLVDATYEPVNAMGKSRDEVITRDYELLREDLRSLLGRSQPIALIKENVCRLLEPKLVADGFNVLNRGRVVYFPSTGRQNQFHNQFSAVTGELI